MGLIEVASGDSVWRGMDYYERKRVASWSKAGDGTYDGVVDGNDGNSRRRSDPRRDDVAGGGIGPGRIYTEI